MKHVLAGTLLVVISLVVGFFIMEKESQRVVKHLFTDYTDTDYANGLLLGSSTLAYIDSQYLPECISWRNRAIGNSSIQHIRHYVQLTRVNSEIRYIVLYVGENDIAYGGTHEGVIKDYIALLQELRTTYPSADIYQLKIKFSPARQAHWSVFEAFNSSISSTKEASMVKFFRVQLDSGDTSIFSPDGVHMNERGNLRLSDAMRGICHD